MKLKMKFIIFYIILFFVLFFVGCGNDKPNQEAYGDLYSSDQGIVLTAAEHESGWGKTNCFLCHNTRNLHLPNNDFPAPDGFDLKGIQKQVSAQGIASCKTCHGKNGL